jgi:CrcB protein
VPQVSDPNPELPLDPDVEDEGRGRQARPLHFRLDALLLVFVGGFVGTIARYGVAVQEPTTTGHWPTGTLAVNLVGAFVLGALLEGLARSGPDAGARQRARLLLGTGFCGALTTYSTLAVEADLLVRDHRAALAAAYLVVSVLAGLLATTAGIAAATGHHRWRRRRGSRA